MIQQERFDRKMEIISGILCLGFIILATINFVLRNWLMGIFSLFMTITTFINFNRL